MQIPYTADAALPRLCSCTHPHTPWLASLRHSPIIYHAYSHKANQSCSVSPIASTVHRRQLDSIVAARTHQ